MHVAFFMALPLLCMAVPLSPIYSAPSLQISAAAFPQNIIIFSRVSTLCPWSIAEPEAKSPAPSKSYPFLSGRRASFRNSYCRTYFQASF